MFCNKCGAQMEQGTKFCTQCGTPVTAEGTREAAKKPAKKKGKFGRIVKRIFLGILAVILLMVVSFLIGLIEIKNMEPSIPDPAAVLNMDMSKELTTYMDGVEYTATVTEYPETKIKEYVKLLKDSYGFDIRNVRTYSYYSENYDKYLNYRLECDDHSFFGTFAENMAYIEKPEIEIEVYRKKSTDPYKVIVTIDDTIDIVENK